VTPVEQTNFHSFDLTDFVFNLLLFIVVMRMKQLNICFSSA